jgi:hypothetical protein
MIVANSASTPKTNAGHTGATGQTGPHTTQGSAGTFDKAKDAVSSAADKARDAASNVADKARDAASGAVEKARDAASSAYESAGQALSDLGHRAESATSSLGGSMRNLAGNIRESTPHQGMLGTASSTVADTLESGGRYLQEEGLQGMAEDLTAVIRRNPIPAILIGVAVGFLLGRTTSRS